MANELQMDLCRVDLSQVSSKYIGETEKNLEKIFREAEQSNVILFFDEADSLFGKRTEVKDSNDKYANQETSYILQRIESYDGMVILATNLARNFDPAFMRRITVSIQFEQPDEATRKLLWQDMLQNTELGGNETLMQELAAQFELTGSYIKSAVRNAVFMALMEDRPLCTADLITAIRIEFEKMGKIPNSSSFGTFFSYIS
jgi:SpoVK/Ycf46/Vps4 family AAA+-type ATPase